MTPRRTFPTFEAAYEALDAMPDRDDYYVESYCGEISIFPLTSTAYASGVDYRDDDLDEYRYRAA